MTRTNVAKFTEMVANRKIGGGPWKEAYEAGDSLLAVAERAGVTSPTMAKWLRMWGVKIRPLGRRNGDA